VKYLLDTMVGLWSVGPTDNIGRDGLGILSSGGEEIHLSVASAWEIVIKAARGNLRLPIAPTRYVPDRLARQGIHPLPVTLTHSLRVYDLPPHHADPFDRLIIAQALTENMVVLTSDRIFEKYPVEIIWCGK
jgi:PIN domain nuclease of toxin-antitoxin system